MFWKDKIIFLTGASSGIGEALALETAKRGAVVGLLARREASLRGIEAQIERTGGRSRVFAADVTDADAVARAARELQNEFGSIDILIANAGIGGNNRETKNLEAAAVARVIDTNLTGAVNAVSAVLPAMLERKSGHLVAISSLAGSRGLPKSAAYCASKAGMNAFFESVRLDVQGKGVFVSIIQPGFIKTPLTSGREAKMPFLMELADSMPYFLDAVENRRKFARFPRPLAAIVGAARFLPADIYDRFIGRLSFRE